MATKKAQEKPKRRSPISRAEGEQRLINAAHELIKTRPFSEVGVREIAELADVNHGFVHTWFGSKNDLLLAVMRKLALELAQSFENAAPGQLIVNITSSEVQLFVRLVLWLNLEGVNTRTALPELPIVKTIEKRYVEIEGMRADVAAKAAIYATSVAIGAVTFAPLMTDDAGFEMADLFGLMGHINKLLAKYPPA
jgi:AcrR family transcriptional regulator